MRINRRLVGIVTAGIVLAGATGTMLTSTASADAPHAADEASLAAVTAAVAGSDLTEGIPASSYTLDDLRVDGEWAAAELNPTGDDLDAATVLLTQEQGAWSLVEIGSVDVGCGSAPEATLTALRLTCSG
ncbi:MAG: hypothetical protein Q4G43_14675 [Mobilicoccus sp.]|nr:hypothetical protein [Mobilicoccus sp.]